MSSMLAPLIWLALGAQAQPALVMPPGCTAQFHQVARDIAANTASGDFEAAKAKLSLLPSAAFSYAWDDSGAPEASRSAFAASRDAALHLWMNSVPGLVPSQARGGALRFVFDAQQPANPRTQLPTSVWVDAPDRSGVRVAHIGLVRGNPARPIRPMDVQNAVAYAVGEYLGVADMHIPGSATTRMDGPSVVPVQVYGYNGPAAKQNLLYADQIRAAVGERRKLPTGAPVLTFAKSALDLGSSLQGSTLERKIEVTNTGDQPLSLRIIPTCGCMAVKGPSVVAPGDRVAYSVSLDTREFTGPVVKQFIVVSGDPKKSSVLYPVRATVTPRFRFLTPNGDVTAIAAGGGNATAYLVLGDDKPIAIKHVEFLGFDATAEFEPWTGSLPDPIMGEASRPRTGYKFTVSIPDRLPPGRTPGTLMVQTDDPSFPVVQVTLYAQKGIVALPDELFFGEIGQGVKNASLLVSRPGRPFKILGASSSSPNLALTIREIKPGVEYAIDIAYDGKAAKGDFNPRIVVRTDDPKQPSIEIPVVGTVR